MMGMRAGPIGMGYASFSSVAGAPPEAPMLPSAARRSSLCSSLTS